MARRGEQVRLWTGDVERIDAPDATYDAVFDFGIVHHVRDWRAAVREIHRVLKPGGRFYAEEVLAAFILNPLTRRLLDHPLEDRFDASMFGEALRAEGFSLVGRRDLGGSFAWFVADRSD